MHIKFKSAWISLAIILSSCFFSPKEGGDNSPCEGGHYSYTQYYSYNALDSLIRMTYVNGAGDTLDISLIEYNQEGFRTKDVWTTKRMNEQWDTSCLRHQLNEAKTQITSTYCNDSTRIYIVSQINELGLVTRIGYYLSSNMFESYALINIYDKEGKLTKIDYEDPGLRYTRKIYFYTENGHWLKTEEYSRAGNLVVKQIFQKIGSDKERIQSYDSTGTITSWLDFYLNKRGKASKKVGCEAQ